MRESYEAGTVVLVYANPSDRSRAEHGEVGIAARVAVIEADVTPTSHVWNPFGDPARRGGAYVAGPVEGPAVYQLRFEDDGSIATANVHHLLEASVVAAAIERRAQASDMAAREHSAEMAKHQAEAERLRAAAQAIQQS